MNTKHQSVVKWLVVCVATAGAIVGFAYLYWQMSTVLVENRAGIAVSDVRVELGGEIFWSGALASGEAHREFGFVTPDDVGNLVFSFTASGSTIKRTFASSFLAVGVHHRLAILPTLEVECEWTNGGPEASC